MDTNNSDFTTAARTRIGELICSPVERGESGYPRLWVSHILRLKLKQHKEETGLV